MPGELEKVKKNRSVQRMLFTRKVKELEALWQDEEVDKRQFLVSLNMLSAKLEELHVLDAQLRDHMCETMEEEELIEEIGACDSYSDKYMDFKIRYDELNDPTESRVDRISQKAQEPDEPPIVRRKYKLPTIQFKCFSGDVKDWLSFWAQFRKIHEDPEIDDHDKIEYLIQATEPNSRARQLVESYPAMSENYGKMMASLQSRFGREELQIEVYVRELLKLVLKNASSHQKLELHVLYDRLETQLRALETLGITAEKYSAMLFPLIESCFPDELLRVWQRSSWYKVSNLAASSTSLASKEDVNLETRLDSLMQFLKNEVENEQRIKLAKEGFGISSANRRSGDSGRVERLTAGPNVVATATDLLNFNSLKCVFCDRSHDSESCFKAQKYSIDEKKRILTEKRACFRCVRVGHQSKKCKARMKCVVCGKSHVTLMCHELAINKPPPNDEVEEKRDNVGREHSLTNHTSNHVFLQTLYITIQGVAGRREVRALIDTGSQRSYVLRSTAEKLGCVIKGRDKVVHCLFGGTEAVYEHNRFELEVSGNNFTCNIEAFDQATICNGVSTVFRGPWTQELSSMCLELSDAGRTGPIELLIGADVAGTLYTGDVRVLQCGLVAVETVLGWTLMGKVPGCKGGLTLANTVTSLLVKDAPLVNLWELDVLGIRETSEKQSRLEMETAAKEFFTQTTARDEEGRYEVRLPWLEGHPPIPENYATAKKRLDYTSRKLRSEDLFEAYGAIFKEWLVDGVIEQVGESTAEVSCHYLPHRAVVKPNSNTTKIRPVFDASFHSKEQPSLNQCLEKGPNLIELIPSVLLRFREERMGVVADIKKAFLQISIHPDDRDYLRFLWIDDHGEEVIYRHRRVVFGVSSSPFLLAAVLERHLDMCLKECERKTKPYSSVTIQKLLNSFYVDNCVTSVSDEDNLKTFIREAKLALQEARFDLRGWEFTRSIKEDEAWMQLLGLEWHPGEDVLRISNDFIRDDDLEGPVTKRKILSMAQRVFDPIGFTCPVTLIPKLILQRLWEVKLTWDQPVDEKMGNAFKEWTEVTIPRWIHFVDSKITHRRLHTFCDASCKAFACVVFLRVVYEDQVKVSMVAAKSRVAPLRQLTLPRLELMAATIGSRLYASIRRVWNEEIESHFWSDSSTVLSWIKRKEEWNVFVRNRVTEIRNLTSAGDWKHVPGASNPADLPSRGCSPKQFLKTKWWEGPGWLYGAPETWPMKVVEEDEEAINKEKRKLVTSLLTQEPSDEWHLKYFSKYNKTVRMIAWIHRFVWNLRNPANKRRGELTAEEFIEAERLILKNIQSESLNKKGDNTLVGLSSFLDEYGLIRLKSRISRRDDENNFRFPIILPAKHPVVRSLIYDTHVRSCHVGTQWLMSLLRENYWILGGRRSIKSAISKCVVCRRQNTKHFEVETPPLPVDRVRDAGVFEVTGVDLAGPLYLKGGEKAWICLFTCAVYRAVHLELITSLSTSCFIQALRRFVARRGRPKVVYSDNGTNFVGAATAFAELNWDHILRDTAVTRIKWRFNPPTAAWWGGFWERLVGVLKQLLRKVLGRSSLHYEDLLTVLGDCEYIVNSRPLTYISGEAGEAEALTPAMFLIEHAEHGVPDCDAVYRNSLSRKLRHQQNLMETLRRRFRSEYLGTLKLFHQKSSGRPVQVGDVVLIGNDKDKRIKWPLGRVTELLVGKDKCARVVKLKTAKGYLVRPVQRIFPLEWIESSSASNRMSDNVGEEERVSNIGTNACKTKDSSTGVKGSAPVVITRGGRVSRMPKRYL